LRGFRISAKTAGGIALAKIDALAELCRQAKYGVVVWAPPTLDVPHAELLVEQATGLVKDLNPTQRFAGLSLGGNEGAVTAAAVSTWQSGFPLRISYASGAPQFDPYRNSILRMLTAGEGDLLVWIASISPDLSPPDTDIPTIVLGTPGLKLPRQPEVFIPVRLFMPVITPGVSAAARRTSRPFKGMSDTVFSDSTSLMLGSSVAIGADVADTVTFSVAWPTVISRFVRTT